MSQPAPQDPRAASMANMKRQLSSAGVLEDVDRPQGTLSGAALSKASMLRELRAQGLEPVRR